MTRGQLTLLEVKVITLMLSGMRTRDIAKQCDVTIERIRQVKIRALKKLTLTHEQFKKTLPIDLEIMIAENARRNDEDRACVMCGHAVRIHTKAYGCARTACECKQTWEQAMEGANNA